jgi:hypothetical protein
MKGSTYKRCWCRDADGRQLGAKCPKLKSSRHGTWCVEVQLPAGPDGKRRRGRDGGMASKAESEQHLEQLLAECRCGERVDVKQTVCDWLEQWLSVKTKPTGWPRARRSAWPRARV